MEVGRAYHLDLFRGATRLFSDVPSDPDRIDDMLQSVLEEFSKSVTRNLVELT